MPTHVSLAKAPVLASGQSRYYATGYQEDNTGDDNNYDYDNLTLITLPPLLYRYGLPGLFIAHTPEVVNTQQSYPPDASGNRVASSGRRHSQRELLS